MSVYLDRCTWAHGRTRSGWATFINAPDDDGEEVLVAIVCSQLEINTREDVAKTICKALKESDA